MQDNAEDIHLWRSFDGGLWLVRKLPTKRSDMESPDNQEDSKPRGMLWDAEMKGVRNANLPKLDFSFWFDDRGTRDPMRRPDNEC